MLGGEFIPPKKTAEILDNLEAPLGVWAIIGNHDVWYDVNEVKEAFENTDIPILENEAVKIDNEEKDFWLAGIGDFFVQQSDIDKTLANIDDELPILAFTHSPDIFPEIPDSISLTITGHTHGGQVYIPFIGRPKVPSKYGEKYAIGHIIENGKHLFVSSGIGTSIIPVRFLVPPEISVLTIVKK